MGASNSILQSMQVPMVHLTARDISTARMAREHSSKLQESNANSTYPLDPNQRSKHQKNPNTQKKLTKATTMTKNKYLSQRMDSSLPFKRRKNWKMSKLKN